jgi:predicted phage tail protein
VNGSIGGIAFSDTNGCAYTKTVSGVNYCTTGNYSTGATMVIGGVSTQLSPTASCSGVAISSSGQQNPSNWKTQIQY